MAHRIYISPARLGSHGQVYDIRLGAPDGDHLGQSRMPFYDGARALLYRGLTGRFEMWSADVPFARMTSDVETCAGLTVFERSGRALQVTKWQPIPVTAVQANRAKPGSSARVMADNEDRALAPDDEAQRVT
jgi:hypothetical protein